MEWINKLHSLCDEQFVAAATSSSRAHRNASSRHLAQAATMPPTDAAPVGASSSSAEMRKRKRLECGEVNDSSSYSGHPYIPLNAVHLDVLRLVLPRCVQGGALSAMSIPNEYIDKIHAISNLSEIHKRKKFLRVLDELVRIDLQNKMSLCLESDLVPVMPPDSGGWSADPSAQQTFLCPLLLVEALSDPDRCSSLSMCPETRELQSLLDATRVALAEADRAMLSLRRSSHPEAMETVTAMGYLQSVLKRIEIELLQIL